MATVVTAITIGISVIALLTSLITAWLTFFMKGTLKMTQPTIISFGQDGRFEDGNPPSKKICIRTLLFSTSRRGQMIESMYINIQRAETKQNFSMWGYDEGKLVRGSGLFVGPNGTALYHHFLLPPDGSTFYFISGDYILRVYAKLVETNKQLELANIPLRISESDAKQLESLDAMLVFDWGPDKQNYYSRIDKRPNRIFLEELLALANQERSPKKNKD